MTRASGTVICLWLSMAAAVSAAGCGSKPPPDRTEAPPAVPSGRAEATERPASAGDPRTECVESAKELSFIENHKACTVDQNCARADTWLYPCGMAIQKGAIPDLGVIDRAVSTTCAQLGFHAPARDCTAAVLRSGCSAGVCGDVVPLPLTRDR